MYQCGKSADKVYADGLCRTVERFGILNVVLRLARTCDERNRSNGNSLVDYRNTELALYILAGFYEVLSAFCNLVIYLFARYVRICIYAVQEGKPHCYCADVEMLVFYHSQCFASLKPVYHSQPLLYSVHSLKNIFKLYFNFNAELFSRFVKNSGKVGNTQF